MWKGKFFLLDATKLLLLCLSRHKKEDEKEASKRKQFKQCAAFKNLTDHSSIFSELHVNMYYCSANCNYVVWSTEERPCMSVPTKTHPKSWRTSS